MPESRRRARLRKRTATGRRPTSPDRSPPPLLESGSPSAEVDEGDAHPHSHGLFLEFLRRPGPRFRAFWSRVYAKATEDSIFFMAGAIAFNVVVAFVPLILLLVGVSGYVLSARFGDPGEVLTALLLGLLPELVQSSGLVQSARGLIDGILEGRRQLSLVGGALLIWLSTRLVGTLRTALSEIFDISQGRGIIEGKLFDVQMVVVGGALFVLNMSITVGVKAARDLGVAVLGLRGVALEWGDRLVVGGLAFVSIWVLFLLIYRYVPARKIPWRTALIAASVMAVAHELLKQAFSWYVTSVAVYSSTYGNLATLAVLFFWVYYASIAFVLAGEIAQVSTMRRAWRFRPVARGSPGAGGASSGGSTTRNRPMGR